MSAVVKSLLKFAFGLISNKLRTYGAEKLKDGDFVEQKFRKLIVSELDDIKFRLDAIALHMSIMFLKKGVYLLNMCLDESVESGVPSTSELPEDGKQSRDTTNAGASSTEAKPAQKSETFANAIVKMKIVSGERFELAKESFKDAEKEATRAFHNAALSTKERILASKVRIASGILKHLDDPEIAASDCLQYLRELHDMPAIQDIFSVHVKGGIKSFNKDSRAKIVETVTMINLILAGFISKFTKRRMGVLDWPMIECGTRVVHPIHYEEESLRKLEEMEITPPWDTVVLKETLGHDDLIALNSKGELLTFCLFADRPAYMLEQLDTTTGMLEPYNTKHSEPILKVGALAVDEDDTVYVVLGNCRNAYTLSVYSADGRSTHDLEFLNGLFCSFIKLAVTKDKNIVICCNYTKDITLYLCDRSGIWIKNFDTGLEDIPVFSVFVSCDNEIVLATKKLGQDFYFHVYAQDGKPQRIAEWCSNLSDEEYRRMVYNPVTQAIIHGGCYHRDHKILIEYLSHQTSDIQRLYSLHLTDLGFSELLCNTIGELALITKDRMIFLKKRHQKS